MKLRSKQLDDHDHATMQSEVFLLLMAVVLILLAMPIKLKKVVKRHRTNQHDQKLADARAKLQIALKKLKEEEQPPLLFLDDKRYSFSSGSFAILKPFRERLEREIIPEIERLSRDFNCDVLEIYGYTDGILHKRRRASNLDKTLLPAIHQGSVIELKSVSNVELGMLRAVSLMLHLEDLRKKGLMRNIKVIRPYSGGQVILRGGEIVPLHARNDDAGRRRIELRLSRSRELHRR